MIVFIEFTGNEHVCRASSEQFSSLVDSFLQLCKEKLKEKQLTILLHAHNTSVNANTLVNNLSEEKNIPKSTLWFNLRVLEDLGFIDFGNGAAVTLHFSAKLLLALRENSIESNSILGRRQ